MVFDNHLTVKHSFRVTEPIRLSHKLNRSTDKIALIKKKTVLRSRQLYIMFVLIFFKPHR